MDTAGYLNRVTRWPHQAGENQAEWSRQVIAKTKHLRGESHMRAKFSDRQVSEMRHMHEVLGVSRVDIASAFGCSYWTVRDILTGRTRKTALPMPDGVTLAKKRKGPTVETVFAGWRGIGAAR